MIEKKKLQEIYDSLSHINAEIVLSIELYELYREGKTKELASTIIDAMRLVEKLAKERN